MYIETRGHSTRRKKNPKARWVILLWDLCALAFLWSAIVAVFHTSPIPMGKSLFGFLALAIASFIFPIKLLGGTLGMRVWALPRAFGIALTAALLWITATLYSSYVAGHPVFLPVEVLNWESLVPAQSPLVQNQWLTLPAYYAMGAWPKQFENHPILFSLPYEKGPPTRFLGHFTARWKMPEVILSFEGPKSPETRLSQKEWRECFTNSRWRCGLTKQKLLEHHLQEMHWNPSAQTRMAWFQVQNPANDGLEQAPAGLWIETRIPDVIRTRVILITELGNFQVLELRDRGGESGDQARTLLKEMIRTFRVSDTLGNGKALSAMRISELNLKAVAQMGKSRDWVSQLAAIQATLLARLTVEPSDLEAYYHLAGSGLIFLRKIAETKKALAAQGAQAESMGILLDEWSAAIRPSIQSAAKYAEDVSPSSTRAKQTLELWLEAQKIQ